jgi:hypothetical protein
MCHLLALLETHHILHVSRIRVKKLLTHRNVKVGTEQLHHCVLPTWNNEFTLWYLPKYRKILTQSISLYKTLNYDDIHIHNKIYKIINDKVLVTTPTLVPSEKEYRSVNYSKLWKKEASIFCIATKWISQSDFVQVTKASKIPKRSSKLKTSQLI